jgi:hypothetical protein
MVGSWPCKVSSKIHINGRHVGEPVREDRGIMMAPETEDRKDPKSACVVRPSYSRVAGVGAKVIDKKENSGNQGRVNRVSKTEQHYPSWVNRVSSNSNTDRQADRVVWVS